MKLVAVVTPPEAGQTYAERAFANSIASDEFALSVYDAVQNILNADPEASVSEQISGWAKRADVVAFYCDYGFTQRMAQWAMKLIEHGRIVEFRHIGENP